MLSGKAGVCVGIPVREVMKIYPFSRAKLIGGAGGLDRIVESANMQEVPHVERWMHPGEILFSAGYAFEGPDGGVKVMERIDAIGAAALAMKPGQCLDRVPENMIACADRIDLPLFQLPEELPYIDHIIPILERINQQQLFQLRRVESIHNQLTQTILREEGLEGICLTLHQVTGKPVCITAPTGRSLLASCPRDASLDTAALQEALANRLQGRGSWDLKPNQCNTIGYGQGCMAICVPIVLHERQHDCLAYLLLDCGSEHLPDTDLMAFEHASSLISIELLKERAIVEQEQKIREKLLEDLLMKRYEDKQMLYRRGLSLGVDLEKPYCIFIIDPDGFEDYINHRLKGSSEAQLQQIKSKIQGMIRAEMEHLCIPQLLLGNSMSMVGMISVSGTGDVARCRAALGRLITRIEAAYPKLYFSAGIGRVQTDITQADAGLREARLALNCSRLPQFQSRDRTACFEELGALTFLSQLTGSQAMECYYQEHIGRLIDYDRERGTDLVNTLDCYFHCRQNLRLTAETLFIHKNSVIYRLKKMESLLGVSLSDSLTAFDLQLCLLLRNIM